MINLEKHKTNFFKGQIDNNFIAFVSAFIVFLSIIALSVILNINTIFSKWDKNISNNVIVQILPYIENGAEIKIAQDDMVERLEKAKEVLNSIKGVSKIRVVEDVEVKQGLIELLGEKSQNIIETMPLPFVIEVKTSNYLDISDSDIQRALDAKIKGVSVFSYSNWAENLISFTGIIKQISWFVLGLLLTISIMFIFYFTKSFLRVQRKVIKVVHIIGAYNSYIAQTFANRILFLSIIGAVIGSLIAVLTIIISAGFFVSIKEFLMIDTSMSMLDILSLVIVPFLVVLTFYKTAKITVVKYLNRMN